MRGGHERVFSVMMAANITGNDRFHLALIGTGEQLFYKVRITNVNYS